MIIYKTTNLNNGKFYIGKDKYNNPKYFGSGIILRQAIRKYGKDNFKKTILQKCNSLKQLDKQEIFWIKKLQPKYNLASGGTGGDTNLYKSIEEKKAYSKKMKHIMKLVFKNESLLQKLNRGNKISNSKKGIKFSKKHKKSLSLAHIKQIPWNLGLTKETDSRIKTKIPWNKGLKLRKQL